MSALETLENELNAAQKELAASEIALMEATLRAESAREGAARLEAAVAALNGSSPPPAAPPPAEAHISTEDEVELSPEEWQARQDKKRRQREKELESQNPLAHVKCQGCGTTGKMSEQMVTAPSGAPLRMLVCGKCGNQVL